MLDSNDVFISSEACKELLVLRNKPTSLFTLMVQDQRIDSQVIHFHKSH
jgi:hypothetical protein